LFRRFDLLLAPAAPCVATFIGQSTMHLGEHELPARANIGLYTQPVSFIGLPAVAVPVHPLGGLPVAVQLIARPWHEETAFRAAAHLERAGIVGSRIAAP
jgi:Asp-tRNA(Asn)/Glu-tRNA(Gln) amidotransferase A subunit family amidase